MDPALYFRVGVVCLSLAPPAAAFSRGASPASCQEMSPVHIRAQPQDPQRSHVTVGTSASTYLPAQLVTVTVRSSRDFMGFLLQARSAAPSGGGSTTVGGSWTLAPPGTHTLRCLSEGDTLTHSDKQLKRNLSFVWRAPDVAMGDVRFHITVVQSYFVYWAGIQSAVVRDGTRPWRVGGAIEEQRGSVPHYPANQHRHSDAATDPPPPAPTGTGPQSSGPAQRWTGPSPPTRNRSPRGGTSPGRGPGPTQRGSALNPTANSSEDHAHRSQTSRPSRSPPPPSLQRVRSEETTDVPRLTDPPEPGPPSLQTHLQPRPTRAQDQVGPPPRPRPKVAPTGDVRGRGQRPQLSDEDDVKEDLHTPGLMSADSTPPRRPSSSSSSSPRGNLLGGATQGSWTLFSASFSSTEPAPAPTFSAPPPPVPVSSPSFTSPVTPTTSGTSSSSSSSSSSAAASTSVGSSSPFRASPTSPPGPAPHRSLHSPPSASFPPSPLRTSSPRRTLRLGTASSGPGPNLQWSPPELEVYPKQRPLANLDPNLNINSVPEVKAKPPQQDGPPPTPDRGGSSPDIVPRHRAWELGMLLGCSGGLGMVLVVGLRHVCRQACGKQTEVTLADRGGGHGRGERGLIHVQECGDLVRVRRITENSFVLLAEYDLLAAAD